MSDSCATNYWFDSYKLFPMEKEFQIGIFLLLIMPSAAMSNYATKIADEMSHCPLV